MRRTLAQQMEEMPPKYRDLRFFIEDVDFGPLISFCREFAPKERKVVGDVEKEVLACIKATGDESWKLHCKYSDLCKAYPSVDARIYLREAYREKEKELWWKCWERQLALRLTVLLPALRRAMENQ